MTTRCAGCGDIRQEGIPACARPACPRSVSGTELHFYIGSIEMVMYRHHLVAKDGRELWVWGPRDWKPEGP